MKFGFLVLLIAVFLGSNYSKSYAADVLMCVAKDGTVRIISTGGCKNNETLISLVPSARVADDENRITGTENKNTTQDSQISAIQTKNSQQDAAISQLQQSSGTTGQDVIIDAYSGNVGGTSGPRVVIAEQTVTSTGSEIYLIHISSRIQNVGGSPNSCIASTELLINDAYITGTEFDAPYPVSGTGALTYVFSPAAGTYKITHAFEAQCSYGLSNRYLSIVTIKK